MQFVKQGKRNKNKNSIRHAALAAIEWLEPRRMLASTPFYGTAFQLPTTIQAEDFDNGGQGVAYYDETKPNQGGQYRLTESVDIEKTTDTGGSYDVCYVLPGEWMLYTVNAPTAGPYNFSFRVASPQAGGTFHIDVDGKAVTGEISAPNTGGYQTWTTISAPSPVNFTAGQHVVGVYFDSAPSSSDPYTMNFNWMQISAVLPTISIAATDPNAAEANADPGVFTVSRTGATASALTVPLTFSGTAVNGTDYQTLASSVTIPAGQSSATVTVTPINRQIIGGSKSVIATLGSGSAFTIGSPSSATVTIADNDTVTTLPTVSIMATDPNAAEANADPGVFTVTRSGATTAALSVSLVLSGTAVNGTDYQTVSGSVTIAAGQSSGSVTITPINRQIVGGSKTVIATLGSSSTYSAGSPSSATVTIADNDTVSPPPTEAPYGGTPWAIPGTIQAENFDTGGEGVAYHDTDTTNDGGAYRLTEGVDIEPTGDSGGGYDVGWTHATEWMKYTVNVATAGTYTFDARVADDGAGGTFHVDFNGVNGTGELTVPNTGAWQTYTDVIQNGIQLTAGTYVMEVFFDSNGANGFDGNYNWFKLTPAAAALPTVSVAATSPNAGESGSVPGVFTVSRSGGSTAAALTVNYTLAGTAINGTDYQTLPGSVTIAAEASSATVTVTPIDEGLSSGSKTVVLTAQSSAAYTLGASSATVTIADNDGVTGSQPDLQIRNYGDTSYSGVGIINTNAAGQVRGNDQAFFPGIFQIQVVNDGSVADSFNITGPGSTSPDWRVWYYDSQVQGRSGGNDITSQVTGGGWNTGVLQPGQAKDFRIEIGAQPTAAAGASYGVMLTATSATNPSLSDVVEAIGQVDPRYEVEVRRLNYAQTTGESGTYLLNIQNYGNLSDKYVVTATGSGTGYTVKYFDAFTGGDDITSAVTGSGWTTSPIGFHALQGMAVQLTSTDGQVHSITLTVTSVGDSSVGQTITISNTAPVAGPSFFPIGVWDQPTIYFSNWQSRGINTLVQYDSYGGQTSIAQWSQAAEADGLYMIRQPSANPADDLSYSNLLAWMQPDEEELPSNNYSAAQAAQEYAALKAVDPSIPVFANFDGSEVVGWQTDVPLSTYPSYLQSTDWDSSGVYPISGWDRPDDLDVSGRAVTRLAALSQGAPQFAIIETSDQLGSWLPPGSPAPQAIQVQAEIWDSIVHGAQGIIYFPQSFTPTFAYDNTSAAVAAEITSQDALITSIGPALESPIDPTSLGVTANAPLEATWRSYDGHEYYIVFNYSNTTTTQQFTLQGTGSAASATVQGEGRTVSLSNGTLTDTFAPYSVHIYVV